MEGGEMIYCNECKNYAEEPYKGRMERETGYIPLTCPHCGSEDFIEAKYCTCGQPTYQDFCDDCYGAVKVALKELQENLELEDSEFEDIIANHFGW